ncbi:DNA polymerase eta isoform X2 [Hypanus sabinus]|uniref:DNA polymerase eta isoform X2 n=1 Tax=Hypanus sabinus TaxID=79690 RepID=UPI0028C4B294|nr:DNA polymerase eta isoform X2 [Hypanus sabinus]
MIKNKRLNCVQSQSWHRVIAGKDSASSAPLGLLIHGTGGRCEGRFPLLSSRHRAICNWCLGGIELLMPVDRGKERVVALVDMDCFYVQVEQKTNPELRGKPCAVVQYKTWQGGGYRQASGEVVAVMSRFAVIERASIDEVYADLTAEAQRLLRQPGALNRVGAEAQLRSTFVEGFPRDRGTSTEQDAGRNREEVRQEGLQAWLDLLPWDMGQNSLELLLTAGAVIVERMRAAVEAETGYRCSAGISHNKVLAKLSCGVNKPNRQTLLPLGSVDKLFDSLPISKIRNLGGKLGDSISQLLNIEYMGQLRAFPEAQLQARFGEKIGSWLFDLCRGLDFEPVRPRHLPKSIGCSKHFLGKEALGTCEQVQYWLLQLSTELQERLQQDQQQNRRVARQLAVGVQNLDGSFQRCCPLSRQDAPTIAQDAHRLIKVFNTAGAQGGVWSPAVLALNLSARNFFPSPTASSPSITHFLNRSNHRPVPEVQSPATANPGSPAKHRAGTITHFFQQALPQPIPNTDPTPARPQPFSNLSPCPNSHDLNPKHSPLQPLPLSNPSTCSGACHSPTPSQIGGDSDHVKPAPADQPSTSFFKRKSLDHSPVKPPSQTPQQPLISPSASSLPPEALVHCRRCGKSTLPWEVAEHEDFHFALELQQSLAASPFPSAPRTPTSPSGQLKKATPLRPARKRARTAIKTLDWYFRKAPS